MNRALVKLFKSHQVRCFQYVIVNHTTFVNCLILVAHFALLLHILTLVTDFALLFGVNCTKIDQSN